MIPRCFPSEYISANGATRIKVNVLASKTGLKEWIDFIPVKNVYSAAYTRNSYNNNGAMEASVVNPSGLKAGIDYVNVYEDAGKTVAWSSNNNGYIPINYAP